MEKFGSFLEPRIKKRDLESFPKGVTINKETGGFAISPHTDTESKLLFGIFYLAEDDKHPELCTLFHQHKEGKTSWLSKPTWAIEEDFTTVKKIEYLPNRMCIILKNDVCWHSVNIPKDVTVDRYTSYYSIWDHK